MRFSKAIWIAVFFLSMNLAGAYAGEKPIQKGDPFPEIKLALTKDPSHMAYLGLSNTGATFRIQDIKADVIIIHIFHSG